MTYTVTLRFQFPAWNEKDGIVYSDILANSKSEAVAAARKQAHNDGHLCGGQGRVTFTAVEDESLPEYRALVAAENTSKQEIAELLAAHPEIGVLQRDGEQVYYSYKNGYAQEPTYAVHPKYLI